ncbi:MAG: diaminopimelate decarboxylase [Rhodospirillaceae bacterium]|nr:MAG: diaminopimelate decarboxylase [Rhodospirillaceae bacterium]
MHHFTYRNGVLHAEDVSIDRIAAEVGTPFYCYSDATLTRHYQVFTDALAGLDATVCFAVKANSNLAVVRTLVGLGAGCDVVSGGELRLALKAGADPRKIVFSGVGKTADELKLALAMGVGQINVESEPELDQLSAIANAAGKTVRVALRVNPDVDAGSHDKISTGRKEDKFGIEWTLAPQLYRKARTLPGIAPTAVAVHIGSQITELAPFEAAFTRVRDLVALLRADGIDIRHVDLGGGLGVPYDHASPPPPTPAAYGDMVRRVFGNLGCALAFEPGRLIVGNAGILVTCVTLIKEGTSHRFTVVDAGMNDLVRPAMYDAHHDVMTIAQPRTAETVATDVVGPVCESSDRFARSVLLPILAPGDLIAFMTAGAYGSSMSSTYNSRPLVPEVLVKGDRFAVVRRRPSFDEMTALEQLPPWIG